MTFYAVTPVAAPRMTRADAWKDRPCVLEYRAFKDQCRDAGIVLPEPPYKVVFWLPFPDSYSMRKRFDLRGKPHPLKPDLDNLLKALWDALDHQDQRQWSVWAEKRWCNSQPGITIVKLDPERTWHESDSSAG